MVVASLSLAAGTVLTFLMANAVVVARGFLLPYTCEKDRESETGEKNEEQKSKWTKEDEILLITS